MRVIVKLPYNRPEGDTVTDPPKVEWNAEKEKVLWEVIAKSRSSESGTDWQGLSSHLQVPLPYLLYRARIRYEEDLRGLTVAQSPVDAPRGDVSLSEHNGTQRIFSGRGESNIVQLNTPPRTAPSPLSIRARLNSLSRGLPIHPSRASGSSILTLHERRMPMNQDKRSIASSDSEIESDQESAKTNEGERLREEADALDRRLKELQGTINNGVLALVRQQKLELKGKLPERGRNESVNGSSPLSFQKGGTKSASNGSRSSTSSPQGSIPSIPSPSIDSLSQSPVSRHLSPVNKSSSPPVLSTGNARGHSHLQYRSSVGRSMTSAQSSTRGSNASSFSDISESSISASALESALLSNIRGGGSRP